MEDHGVMHSDDFSWPGYCPSLTHRCTECLVIHSHTTIDYFLHCKANLWVVNSSCSSWLAGCASRTHVSRWGTTMSCIPTICLGPETVRPRRTGADRVSYWAVMQSH